MITIITLFIIINYLTYYKPFFFRIFKIQV